MPNSIRSAANFVHLARVIVLTFGIALSGAVLLTGSSAKAETISAETRTALFSTLRLFLSQNSVSGVFKITNDPTRAPVGVRLKSLHPVLLKKRGTYMLCADFTSTDGKIVLIDFFLGAVAQSVGSFRVNYYVVGNRNRFFRLFERLL